MYYKKTKYDINDQIVFDSFYAFAVHTTLSLLDKTFSFLFGWADIKVCNCFSNDPRYFYGEFRANEKSLYNLYKNIRKPQRFFKKLFYSQLVPIPKIMSLCTPLPRDFSLSDQAKDIVERLKHDGVVILPGVYNDYSNYLLDKYQIDLDKVDPSENGEEITISHLDQTTFEVFSDSIIISSIGAYFNAQPFLRQAPSIFSIRPSNNVRHTREYDISNSNLKTMGWHYDTVNMIQCAILLNDITENDTHMQIVKGVHRKHRIKSKDRFYSDEYINDHFEIVRCVGPAGTLVFFDSNSPHRIFTVKHSLRIYIKATYTPGNDIVSRVFPEQKELQVSIDGLDMSKLSNVQKNIYDYLDCNKN